MIDDAETQRALNQWEVYCRGNHERRMHAERTTAAAPAPDDPWLLIEANPNCERRAVISLAALGFETWAPKRVIEHRVGRQGHKACKLLPVVGGLILARHVNPNAWTATGQADGVKRVIRFGEQPALAPNDRVIAWRNSLMPRFIDDAVRIGDRVIISQGALAGLQAVVERLTGKSGAVVALSLFGQPTRASVAIEHVESVG